MWYAVNFKKRDVEFDVTAGVDNVFNVSYEAIRAYAMPGRVWRVGLNCSFIQKPKQTEEIHILLD